MKRLSATFVAAVKPLLDDARGSFRRDLFALTDEHLA